MCRLTSGKFNRKDSIDPPRDLRFYDKGFNAQDAGAIGVVLYNNAAGQPDPHAGWLAYHSHHHPGGHIGQVDGNLCTRLAGGPVDITWTDQDDCFGSPDR